jgi:ferredoxin
VTASTELLVDPSRCTVCGACATLAPRAFRAGKGACTATSPPEHGPDLIAAARLLCPTDAIVARGRGEPRIEEPEGELFDELASRAEAVRWSLADIPWSDLDPAGASPALRALTREMAFSENATYSATQRFLDAFYDDVDFTRWIAVWFYEETRHPHVLLEWLRRVGEAIEPDFVQRARVSTPFVRSPTGTLVMNVVSELTASQAYAYLARTSPEPVLSRLASFIAGDEARHGASFHRFARRRLAAMPEETKPREIARGLEVLLAWLGGAGEVTHPVGQMLGRLSASGTDLDFDLEGVRRRAVRIVGSLLGVPLRDAADVAPAVREILASRSR